MSKPFLDAQFMQLRADGSKPTRKVNKKFVRYHLIKERQRAMLNPGATRIVDE
jgi:hypothetical protein